MLVDPGVVDQSFLSAKGWYKSTSSHNVLAVYEPHELKFWNQKETFPIAHKNHLFSAGRFLKTEDTDQYSIMVSSAEIYQGKYQIRIICWIKENGLLLVADKLSSDNMEVLTWDQLLHGNGNLTSTKDSFIFNDPKASLKGFTLTKDNEVKTMIRPDGINGPEKHIAIRKKASSFIVVTVMIPFREVEPEKPALINNQYQLGENISLSYSENSILLLKDNQLLWQS